MFNIGTAHTGTLHATAGNSSNRGSGAACNNRIGVRTIALRGVHLVSNEHITELRAAGAPLCQRCFGKG